MTDSIYLSFETRESKHSPNPALETCNRLLNFLSTGVWTQQALYHLTHVPRPPTIFSFSFFFFALVIFQGEFHIFCPQLSCPQLPVYLVQSCVTTAWLIDWDRVSLAFWPDWPWTFIPLNSWTADYIYLPIIFFPSELGFKFRALCLQGRCSTAWASLPALLL
jgi:hypothetical protein